MPNKTDIQTEIDLLAALETGKVTSQLSLSQRIEVSVGLINALIKRAIFKGYVKARSAPAKRYAYYLTPKGFSEKSRLVAEYLETSLDFFRMARAEYGDIFKRHQHDMNKRIILGGRGELAEIALLAAREQGLEPTAIFDRETNAEFFHGLSIMRNYDDLRADDIIIVTESRYPQFMIDSLREHQDTITLLAPSFLRISAPEEVEPAQIQPGQQKSGDDA